MLKPHTVPYHTKSLLLYAPVPDFQVPKIKDQNGVKLRNECHSQGARLCAMMMSKKDVDVKASVRVERNSPVGIVSILYEEDG